MDKLADQVVEYILQQTDETLSCSNSTQATDLYHDFMQLLVTRLHSAICTNPDCPGAKALEELEESLSTLN